MSRPPSSSAQRNSSPPPSSSPEQRRFYINNSSSTSQLHTTSSRSSQGNTSAFFDRRNFFGRNRPRTSGGVGAADSSADNPSDAHVQSSANNRPTSSNSPRRPTSSRSISHSTGLWSSPDRNRNTDQSPAQPRLGFPSTSSPAPRSPYEEATNPAASADGPTANSSSQPAGRRLFGMASMARTNSSGNNGNGAPPFGVSGSSPSQSPSTNDRSGSAFGRMFRRYSHGQGRTASNATDPATMPGGLLPHSASSASFTRPNVTDTSNPAPPAASATSAMPSQGAPSPSFVAAANPSVSDVSSVQPAIAPAGTNPSVQAGMHRIRLVPHLEATRSLHFEPIERDVREGATAVKIGRFTDRHPPAAAAAAAVAINNVTVDDDHSAPSRMTLAPTGSAPGNRGGAVSTSAGGGGRIDSARIAFKSKVVSRGHAEVWCEPGGKFFIRDTKSSSGTFLNHIRLSAPNLESRPFAIKDGDILQLGVDYQGGTEEIYRCVKIRVELNRGWQREANQFNVNALRQLRALQGSPIGPAGVSSSKPGTEGGGQSAVASALPTNRQSMSTTDCCICLFSVTVCQALFIAPCSHVFHYKCIRPLLNQHHPGFSCPLCRTFADLEADVEQDEAWQEALLKEVQAVEASRIVSPTSGVVNPTEAGSGPSSNQGHGEGGRGGTAAPTPSQELSSLDLGPTSVQAEAGSAVATSSTLTPSVTSGPAAPSPLRQQVVRNAAAAAAAVASGTTSSRRPVTADRPSTAVGDGPPPGAATFFGDDPSMTAIGRGGALEGNGDDADETEEVLDDSRLNGRFGGNNTGLEIERIPEEAERSETSLDSSRGLDDSIGSGFDAVRRRPSQPINIRSSAASGAADSSRRSSAADRSNPGGGLGNNAQYSSLAGYSGFSPLEESRTPVNQHVLSVLAEAPPPGSIAARRFAEHQQQRRTSHADSVLGDRRPSAVPSEDLHFATPGEGNSLSGHDSVGDAMSGSRRRSSNQPSPAAHHHLQATREAEGTRSSSTFTTGSGSGEATRGDEAVDVEHSEGFEDVDDQYDGVAHANGIDFDDDARGVMESYDQTQPHSRSTSSSNHPLRPRTSDGHRKTSASAGSDKGKYRREDSDGRRRESSSTSEHSSSGGAGGKMKKIFFRKQSSSSNVSAGQGGS
ncbi:unnamed protein product [Sympodiomycopsis kandeliae]